MRAAKATTLRQMRRDISEISDAESLDTNYVDEADNDFDDNHRHPSTSTIASPQLYLKKA